MPRSKKRIRYAFDTSNPNLTEFQSVTEHPTTALILPHTPTAPNDFICSPTIIPAPTRLTINLNLAPSPYHGVRVGDFLTAFLFLTAASNYLVLCHPPSQAIQHISVTYFLESVAESSNQTLPSILHGGGIRETYWTEFETGFVIECPTYQLFLALAQRVGPPNTSDALRVWAPLLTPKRVPASLRFFPQSESRLYQIWLRLDCTPILEGDQQDDPQP
ncbi:MAG: hypothetical protein D6722_24680 [Bacteroidetes bacterium]|nr:MAG: hypothetical protein D6722_24680 [Bacteroidota bacterium]